MDRFRWSSPRRSLETDAPPPPPLLAPTLPRTSLTPYPQPLTPLTLTLNPSPCLPLPPTPHPPYPYPQPLTPLTLTPNPVSPPPPPPLPPSEALERVVRVERALFSGRHLVLLGASGAGRRAALSLACHMHGIELYTLGGGSHGQGGGSNGVNSLDGGVLLSRTQFSTTLPLTLPLPLTPCFPIPSRNPRLGRLGALRSQLRIILPKASPPRPPLPHLLPPVPPPPPPHPRPSPAPQPPLTPP